MEISYTGPRMQGADSTFQQWQITPQSSNQYWQPNDVIKFMGNISQGLVDFYRSHIQVEIEVTPQMMPVGLLQIDNSIQSLFSQTVLQSNQVEIERIQDYDVLAAGLTDIGFSQIMAQGKAGEGIGYTNLPTNSASIMGQTRTGQTTVDVSWINSGSQTPSYIVQNNNVGTFSPILNTQYGTGYTTNVAWMTPGSDAAYGNTISSGLAGGSLQSVTNWLTFPWNTDWANIYTQQTGRAMAVRAQYTTNPQMTSYPDAPYSTPLTGAQVQNQTWSYNTMNSTGYNPKNPYVTTYSKRFPDGLGQFSSYMPSTCAASGYTKPFCADFATGGSQPFLSPTVPQLQMRQGMILPQPIPLGRKKFRMPLISAILGILIPPDQFKLIPAASLKNIILQITFNPYAFFTSGYSDVHQFDSFGMQTLNMQRRYWRINSIIWSWHLYTFNSASMQASINEQLTKGIVISSNYWQQQAQYQLANGAAVRASFNIPVQVESLAQVWCMFLSNQYQTKSFCRKQFRLSNNIYSMQFKANGNYYPLQPIQGNAGNPEAIDTTGDNWNFIEPLYLSYNFLFNTNTPCPRINPKNFAINGRIYDTTNQRPLLPISFYKKPVSQTNTALDTLNSLPKYINGDTALGQAWFHQNRYIGKAIYCYSFEPYGHSKGLITGLNTIGFRQFDVTFNNSPRNVFPSDQTLYIFTRANVVVRFTEQGITVLGA